MMYARNVGDNSMAAWHDCGGLELMKLSRGLPLSLDQVGRNFTLLFTLTPTETTAEYLQKLAEVIEFAEDN